MDNTLIITCLKCGNKYELKPVKEDPNGGGWYSSDKDFCRNCDGPTKRIFKDGRPAIGPFEELPKTALKN